MITSIIDGEHRVKQQIESVYNEKLELVIEQLNRALEDSKTNGFIELTLETYQPEYTESYYLGIFGYRKETREETERRAKVEYDRNQFERKQYEALKAKFENASDK